MSNGATPVAQGFRFSLASGGVFSLAGPCGGPTAAAGDATFTCSTLLAIRPPGKSGDRSYAGDATRSRWLH
jgi:hypothetical protein